MRFTAQKIKFGPRPAGDDDDLDDDGLPNPHRVKLQRRRAIAIREAKELLAELPGPGESVHALMSRRMDLADVIGVILERGGKCERLAIATLGYHARNLRQLLAWMDGGQVAELTLLASTFFRSHNGSLWEQTQEAFAQRGQRAACAASHAKVCTLAFSTGERFVIEGSSNLCGNGSAREQFALIRDDGLHDWHRQWVVEMVSKHG